MIESNEVVKNDPAAPLTTQTFAAGVTGPKNPTAYEFCPLINELPTVIKAPFVADPPERDVSPSKNGVAVDPVIRNRDPEAVVPDIVMLPAANSTVAFSVLMQVALVEIAENPISQFLKVE